MVLMCGLAGAGKSTYARALEQAGWARFSIDGEAYRLGHRRAPLPDDVTEEIRARQWLEIEWTLRSGADVVVDYAFWSRRQRDAYRALGVACGAAVQVVHIDVPETVLRARLARRRGEGPDDVVVDADVLAGFLTDFEPPTADEGDLLVLGPDADAQSSRRAMPG